MRRLFSQLIVLASFLAGPAQAAGELIQDHRIVIPVSKAERDLLLTEMREYLHGLHAIQYALAGKDTKTLDLIAKDMAPRLERLPASLRERLPEDFLQLAIAQKEAFLALARMSGPNLQVSAALEQTGEIITYCSGCHDTYRFEVRVLPKRRK